MGQQIQPWRSGSGERLWLSMLIDAMEVVSMENAEIEKRLTVKGLRRDMQAMPCQVPAALWAQLALPASPYGHGLSPFSLRN
jgi:hypothetical protein